MDNFRVRFIPLGGIVDVTKNMYVYELYRGDELVDILIVDCGIGFPKEKELGVDFIIPDISYLKDKKDKIRAVVLTHGHEDHISALRFHYESLGKPPVYGSKLTALLTEEKFKEFGLPIRVNQIQYRKDYVFGNFKVSFIHMTHSIPDATHVLVKTPIGVFYHGPDYKLDLTPPYTEPPDFYAITRAGEEGVLCLLSDCLGVSREGAALSEKIVSKTFEEEIRSSRGRFIMTTFSSNISRIRQCAEAAVKFNRSICFLGRSMKDNTELAKEIGYLPLPRRLLVDDKRVAKLPPHQVCIIAAGSQGQYDSALSKIANNQNRYIKIEKGDKVFFSSDPIPGQEEDVYDLIERLYLIGANVVYSDIAERLHASGHGNQEDMKFLMRFVKPKYVLPIGGTIRHQRQYRDLVMGLGYTDDKILLLKEGETLFFDRATVQPGPTIETRNIFVDAYGVGDVGNIILRDRKTLSQEGVVFCMVIVDKAMQILQGPEFISRGFIFKTDETQVFGGARGVVEKTLRSLPSASASELALKQESISALEEYFFKKTGRRPLVVVEVIKL